MKSLRLLDWRLKKLKRNYNRCNINADQRWARHTDGAWLDVGPWLIAGSVMWFSLASPALWAAPVEKSEANASEEDFSLDAGNIPVTTVKDLPTMNAGPSANEQQSNADLVPVDTKNSANAALPISNGSPNPVEAPSENIQQPADIQAQQPAAAPAQPPSSRTEEQPLKQAQPVRDKPFVPLPDNVQGGEYGPKVPVVAEPNEFGGVPVVNGTRKTLARDEAPERYIVEGGDTLYDICDQLLDEPNYWPKLWSLNPFIKNPHFIYPGMQLMFHGGDEDTPPFLQVITEDDVVPIDKANLVEGELVREDISKLLTDSATPQPTQVIGPQDISAEIQVPFDAWGNVFDPDHLDIAIPAFIFKDERNPLGTIVGGEKGKFLSTTAELVVIKSRDQLNPKTSYTVLREGDKVYTHNNTDYVGVRYEFIAHVNLNEKLGEDVYNAKVTFDRLGIKPGDIVVPYISTNRKIPTGSVKISKQADSSEVVAFSYPKNELGGRGSVVMLANRDAVQLNEGDVIGVYHQLNRTITSFLASDLPDNKMLIAVVYIFANTDAVSLGYVVQAQFELSLGDTANLGSKM